MSLTHYPGAMRRAVITLALLSACLTAAGCGSSGTSKVRGPVATELSYFAPGTPFVAAVQTNPKSSGVQNAQGLLGSFPVGQLAITAFEAELLPATISYQSDIEPLYGNALTLGVLEIPGPSSLTRSSFLAVWVTRSARQLDTVIKAFSQLHSAGSYDGATLYRTAGAATFAVDGATLLFASSQAGVQAALNRHAHGRGMSSAGFSQATSGLSAHPLVQAFGSLSSLLSSPGAASARKIPWVAAIRNYAAAISSTSSGLTVQFRLDTSGGSLTGAELPIAGGTATPEVAGTLPISVGVRDPAQSFAFIEAAERATDPAGYARFVEAESAAKGRSGYDLNTFAALLTGDLVIESNTKTTMARAEVSDPASAARQLAALAPVVRDVLPAASGISRLPGGFYAIRQGHGKAFDLGLVGHELAAGLATPAQLRAFAAAPATAVPGAQGSVAVRIGLLELLRVALRNAPSQLVQSVLSTLGDVTGSVSATPAGLTGHLSLAVK